MNWRKKAALASGVLLKNEDQLLPLQKEEHVAVIGELAKTPRYQGTGSSQVTPTKLDSILEGMNLYTSKLKFASGYSLREQVDNELLVEAVKVASESNVVVVCLGLTDIFESEGYDRNHMCIPTNQIALLEAVAKVNENIVIVLVGGSAVEMPWEKFGSAILHMQLSGQAGGTATADLLFGEVSPSGKLAESYPYLYRDVVNSNYYNVNPKLAPYKESMFCGYRYFSSANVPVRYPFGFGLSYTKFEYFNLAVIKTAEYEFDVSVTIKNIGDYDGAEVIQLYIASDQNGAYRPIKELKGFSKVHLKQGESTEVQFTLDKRSFAIYDPTNADWVVESGTYNIQIGASVEEIRLTEHVSLTGKTPIRSSCSEWFYTLKGEPTKEDFVTIHGEFDEYIPLKQGRYDMTSSIREMSETSLLCKIMYKVVERVIAKQCGGKVDYNNPSFKMMMDSAVDNPMKSLPLFSPEAMPVNRAEFFCRVGKWIPI